MSETPMQIAERLRSRARQAQHLDLPMQVRPSEILPLLAELDRLREEEAARQAAARPRRRRGDEA